MERNRGREFAKRTLECGECKTGTDDGGECTALGTLIGLLGVSPSTAAMDVMRRAPGGRVPVRAGHARVGKGGGHSAVIVRRRGERQRHTHTD